MGAPKVPPTGELARAARAALSKSAKETLGKFFQARATWLYSEGRDEQARGVIDAARLLRLEVNIATAIVDGTRLRQDREAA